MAKNNKLLKKVKVKGIKETGLSFSQRLYLQFYLFTAFKINYFQDEIVSSLNLLKKGLKQESKETKLMLDIYLRQSQGKATKREIRKANKQLRDVIKGLGLGIFLLLPFSPITLPLIVKLGKTFGIEVLPDAFNRKN